MDDNHFIALMFTLWASLQQVGRAGNFHLLRY